MSDQMVTAFLAGRLMGLKFAAQHFESNIKGSLDPKQVDTMLRALADVEEEVPCVAIVEEPEMTKMTIASASSVSYVSLKKYVWCASTSVTFVAGLDYT